MTEGRTPDLIERAGSPDRWVTVQAERALYVDHGVETILCDRLASPIIIVLKNPVLLPNEPLSIDDSPQKC